MKGKLFDNNERRNKKKKSLEFYGFIRNKRLAPKRESKIVSLDLRILIIRFYCLYSMGAEDPIEIYTDIRKYTNKVTDIDPSTKLL